MHLASDEIEAKAPRLLVAGTSSGCGKTTLVCAILKALVERGLRVGAFKCGPDYIDPMFYSRITGTKSGNLDSFFFNENTTRYLLARGSADHNASIIEGAMGYYDGTGLIGTEGSAYDVARITDTPVVLVVDAKGAALSVLAVIHGFLSFRPDSRICGVILNRCSSTVYHVLARAISEHFGRRVQPIGYLPVMKDCVLDSRHLGLVTPAEVVALDEK